MKTSSNLFLGYQLVTSSDFWSYIIPRISIKSSLKISPVKIVLSDSEISPVKIVLSDSEISPVEMVLNDSEISPVEMVLNDSEISPVEIVLSDTARPKANANAMRDFKFIRT
ncbi:hypothetical protein X798_00700 [Onchocerca flexuosa]|uniref:Uncharacterized protein n=1 Tax=Onchocerca flexuosa TaxID=387005 RepID=A0A238C407_9BILA|nr:hypothetical protein X798_00700 [Onchocerca flexuosa]